MNLFRSRVPSSSRWGIPALVLALAVVAACGSDDYSGVGGVLPTDAGQDADSVEVQLPPIFPVSAVVVTPQDTVPAEERPVLYIGERTAGGWRAAMLFRFAVGDSVVQEQFPPVWEDAGDFTELRVAPLAQDRDVAVTRTVRVYELLNPLSPDDVNAPDLVSLLGTEIATGTIEKEGDSRVRLPRDLVRQWVEAGTHNGIAVVHESPDATVDQYSSFRGYAGEEFRTGLRLASGASGKPEIWVDYEQNNENLTMQIPVEMDLTHFERDLPGPQDLQIGSYFERRVWLDFDLGANTVPIDATVNAGTLVLQVREDLTLQVRPYNTGPTIRNQQVRAWEAVRSEAGDGNDDVWGDEARRVIGGTANFNPQYPPPATGEEPEVVTELRINVTEYVQRQVNEIAPDDLPAGSGVADVGLLLAFTGEKLDLNLGVFYGMDAPDALKPRLEITYTPPANTWQ